MSDELPKKVFSTPPPPTDEIDGEWGAKGEADEKATKTATEAAEAAVAPAKDSGPPGADAQLKEELTGQAESAAAPGTPPPAAASDDDDEEEEDEDDDEEEDEDEDDDEEEDDDHSAARAHGSHAPVTRSGAPSADDWIPDWAPWAILGALVVLGVIGGLGAFTKPPAEASPAVAAETAPPTSVAASHFLVMYKGSMRAPETITRTKEEAKARALEGLAKVKKGEDFAKVVGEYSDEPGAAQRGGALGEFTPDRMVKPFADAAFALKVGQVSGLVETAFGYHVIKRTK